MNIPDMFVMVVTYHTAYRYRMGRQITHQLIQLWAPYMIAAVTVHLQSHHSCSVY